MIAGDLLHDREDTAAHFHLSNSRAKGIAKNRFPQCPQGASLVKISLFDFRIPLSSSSTESAT